MKEPAWAKILNHLDRDEIISKLSIGILPQDIHDWLKGKYSLAGERKYVLSIQALKSFQSNYFDFYQTLKNDFATVRAAPLATTDQLDLAVKNNPSYKNALVGVLNEEIDLKAAISRLCIAVETRLGQIHDIIQEEYYNDPRSINVKVDRLMIEYINAFSPLLEKANKIINEAPDQIVQHNVTVQHIDQHIGVFYEAIRETLSEMNLEHSMVFMESFNAKLKKLQDPAMTPVNRLQEVKALNSTITAVLDA